MFAFDNIISYLVGTKVIVYTAHATMQYLLNMKDDKTRLIRWILLFKQYDIDIGEMKDLRTR